MPTIKLPPLMTPPEVYLTDQAKEDTQYIFENHMQTYMCPPPEIRRIEHHMLNPIIIDGGMGSGKTTTILYLAKWAINKILSLSYCDEDQIIFVYANSMPINEITSNIRKDLDLRRTNYIFILNDDAIAAKGQHARSSLAKENVATAQFYVNMRHQFDGVGLPNECAIIPVHATQVITHIDRIFKVTSYMTIFKDWPNERLEQEELEYQLGSDACVLLRHITNIRKFSDDPAQRVRALSSFIVKSIDPTRPILWVHPNRATPINKYTSIFCPIKAIEYWGEKPGDEDNPASNQSQAEARRLMPLNAGPDEIIPLPKSSAFSIRGVQNQRITSFKIPDSVKMLIEKAAMDTRTSEGEIIRALIYESLYNHGYLKQTLDNVLEGKQQGYEV